ncbi:MAG TPA: SDR family oxidoreductase [Terracidiphilus sp.]|nr:SDR family oxidoreductase [Terracidiphilus sp.]
MTGASRGVGQRIAVSLARHGATVALVARSKPALQQTHAQLEGDGARSLVVSADLARQDSIETVKNEIERELGAPSILVNAAGIFGPIEFIQDTDPSAWIETIRVNTIAPFLTCRAFVGGMIASGWGRIVNVTSAAALHTPGEANSAYATSKVALNQFTRHLAAELANTGVTANVIHPGDVKTEMWADIREKARRLGRAGEAYAQWADWVESTGGDDPQKAADLVLELMGDSAANVNGRFLWIKDGLQTPIPSWGEAGEGQPWRR